MVDHYEDVILNQLDTKGWGWELCLFRGCLEELLE